ncbi:MAG: hypothetical protein QM534_06345 [Sediminibacterium sp.]|nr:hypothetical protein [Sediminibacterium sp.]
MNTKEIFELTFIEAFKLDLKVAELYSQSYLNQANLSKNEIDSMLINRERYLKKLDEYKHLSEKIISMLPDIYPTKKKEIEIWVKSELLSISNPDINYLNFSLTFLEYYNTVKKLSFVSYYLFKNKIIDLDFRSELDSCIQYLVDNGNEGFVSYVVSEFFESLSDKDKSIDLWMQAVDLFYAQEQDNNTVILTLLSFVNDFSEPTKLYVKKWMTEKGYPKESR